MWYNHTSDYLCHWGIKGMKWGVRRYQNKDGTLTPLGKKRLQEKIGEVENIDRLSSKQHEKKLRELNSELESTKKKGYKKWADDFGYEDFDDDDKKYEFEKELGYIKYDIKSTQLWLNASKELSKSFLKSKPKVKDMRKQCDLLTNTKIKFLRRHKPKNGNLTMMNRSSKFYLQCVDSNGKEGCICGTIKVSSIIGALKA